MRYRSEERAMRCLPAPPNNLIKLAGELSPEIFDRQDNMSKTA